MALTLSEPGIGDTYVRGGAGLAVGGRTVLRVGAAALLLTIAVVTAVLFVGAAHENSMRTTLREHGVSVPATVTSCYGIATGTGITVNGYVCQAAVDVAGERRIDQLRGTSTKLRPGRVVAAVADPRHPSVLYLASALAGAGSPGHAYVRAFVSLGILVLAALLTAWWWRRQPEPA